MKRISQAAVLAFAAGAAVVGAAGGAVASDGGHGGFDGLVAKSVGGLFSNVEQEQTTTLFNVCGNPIHGFALGSFIASETTCVNKN
ncbi:chaplin [Actinacidiphila oryziradicis]|uniref:Chaplin n=1 Tax=Actinacidiphila oryziradicis TaxID=2571141 RepID=A0A4V5N0M7_9ACTN|nr:chaplin [Actinacidiphila oryziradicis]TKA12589.1 chaplin [Actinacidiphila oryziradicis]